MTRKREPIEALVEKYAKGAQVARTQNLPLSVYLQHFQEFADELKTALSASPAPAVPVEPVVKPPFEFDRYINGELMAEGVTIELQTTVEGAARAAARIASRGRNGEVPVLVLRSAPATSPAPAVPVEPVVKPLDLSTLLRHAFLSGRGLSELDKLSAEDQAAWVEYDPEPLKCYQRISAALATPPAPAVGDGWKAEALNELPDMAKSVGMKFVANGTATDLREENERLQSHLDRIIVKFADEQARATTAEALLEKAREALRGIIAFHDGPDEAKRPDVFLRRVSAARATLQELEVRG